MLDTVQLLCEFGANVNYSSGVFFGETPLHFAATHNDYALIELLFRYNANVHARNHAGYTPLHVAAQNGNEASAIALFLCGADLNAKENYCGYTPLHLAVIGQFEHVVRATVSLGARINQSDNCGLTPIERDPGITNRCSSPGDVESRVSVPFHCKRKNKENFWSMRLWRITSSLYSEEKIEISEWSLAACWRLHIEILWWKINNNFSPTLPFKYHLKIMFFLLF